MRVPVPAKLRDSLARLRDLHALVAVEVDLGNGTKCLGELVDDAVEIAAPSPAGGVVDMKFHIDLEKPSRDLADVFASNLRAAIEEETRRTASWGDASYGRTIGATMDDAVERTLFCLREMRTYAVGGDFPVPPAQAALIQRLRQAVEVSWLKANDDVVAVALLGLLKPLCGVAEPTPGSATHRLVARSSSVLNRAWRCYQLMRQQHDATAGT